MKREKKNLINDLEKPDPGKWSATGIKELEMGVGNFGK